MKTHELACGSAKAVIAEYGATIVSLSFRGRDVFVGYDDLARYVGDDGYVGAGLGRVSGRIGDASLPLGGRTVQVAANADDDQLHGGPEGFARRTWATEEVSGERLVLGLVSDDGDQGFPGRLAVRATFTLTESALRVDYEATSDAPTPVSLTHHPYVRLSGDDILSHRITANAAAWTPLTEAGIPTGEVAPVTGTPLDLSAPVAVSDIVEGLGAPLDHGIVCPDGVRLRVSDPAGHALTITSDHTHCQLYGGHKLGRPLGPHAGLAVEPQGWPDAEKHDAFEDRIVRPGAVYRRFVAYADG